MSEQLELQFVIWVMVIGAAAAVSVTYFICKVVYKVKLLEREERRLMIERGMVPPPAHPAGWPGVKARELELKAEERRLLIEKGMQPGSEGVATVLAELLPKADEKPVEHHLRSGLTKLAFGLGLAGAYVVFNASGIDASSETRNWFLFFGVISPAITLWGISGIVYYRVARNKQAEISGRDQVR